MVVARPGREHIPGHPRAFVAVRFISLIVGLVALACDAYTLSRFAFSGNALMAFTCVANLIVCLYVIIAELGSPKLYNYWAVLALDIFMAIFWLISFALLASQVAPLFKDYEYCDYWGDCYSYDLEGSDLVWSVILAAVAGLGGLEFALYLITLLISSLYLCRHRKAGGHSKAGTAAGATAAGGEKTQAGVTYSSVPLQDQQPYHPPQQHQVNTAYTGAQTAMPPVAQQQQQHVYPAGQTMAPPAQPQLHQPQPYYPQQTPSPLTAQSPVSGYAQQQPQYHEMAGAQGQAYYPQQHQQQ